MRALYWCLALLWLALSLPHVATRYSYTWDSSQFERGVEKFDIAHHQTQPPGYTLWILALKGLTHIIGRANSAQVLLALLFTVGGLFFLPRWRAKRWAIAPDRRPRPCWLSRHWYASPPSRR